MRYENKKFFVIFLNSISLKTAFILIRKKCLEHIHKNKHVKIIPVKEHIHENKDIDFSELETDMCIIPIIVF